MSVEGISKSLVRNADGIYLAAQATRVSYPEEGHAQCLQVEDRSFWFRHRNACIGAMVARHPCGGRFFDIGGGNGFVSQMLAERGLDVVLVEPGYAGALNAHKQRGLDPVIAATVEDAGLFPGSIGGAGLFDTIEHIEDDRGFLERLTPLMAPAARLYLSVPCYGWLWSQADVDAGHFRRHTEKSLRRLLHGLFEVDYLTYFFQPLVLPQLALRSVPYRLGFGRRPVLTTEAEHGAGSGPAVRVIERLLRREVDCIARGGRMAFGASALVAAHRR